MKEIRTTSDTIAQSDQKESLISEITQYLNDRDNDGDGEPLALRLLRAARDLLEDISEKERGTRGAENSTKVLLRSIEKRLTRIKKQHELQKAAQHKNGAPRRTYATVAKSSRNDGAPSTETKTTLPKHPRKQNATEKRSGREITIRVTDEKEREEIRKGEARTLVENIKKAAPAIVGVNRLASGDIKITAASEEKRNRLMENSQWVKTVGVSAAL